MKYLTRLAIIVLLSACLYISMHHPGRAAVEEDQLLNQLANKPSALTETLGIKSGEVDTQSNGEWQVLLNETFEGAWPSSGWSVVDLSNDGYDRKWEDDNYKHHGGYWGVWPARGGTDGRDPVPGNDHYFNSMNTRMIYGPFDLSDAVKTDISFWLWREIEICCDYLALEVSTDNGTFHQVYRWTSNNLDWGQWIFSLDGFNGNNSVWISWRFYSDSSIVYDGPWVDDILLRKYVPGEISAFGTLSYSNRVNNSVGARFMNVYLFDADPGYVDDLLAVTTTNADGFFMFPTTTNWDVDDNDPDPNNRRLDLYVKWETDFNDSVSAHHLVKNYAGSTYEWPSMTWWNVNDGILDCSSVLPAGWPGLEAMWIFQDLRQAWEFVHNNTISQTDPGSVIAIWQVNEDCFYDAPFLCNSFFYSGAGGPFIFVSNQHRYSADTIVHEIGHHYMYNATGWWWWNPSCWDHQLFNSQDVNCAWSEGWGDFLPLVVNNDQCFDFGIGPCTGIQDYNYYDLETHGIGDQFPWGDAVEGRVAGALYDIFDNGNEGYDSASFGFAPIGDNVFQGLCEFSFYDFWEHWMWAGYNKHHTVRAIYQNTIDYDTEPVFNPQLPDLSVLENHIRQHAVNLWLYSFDNESTDPYLTYEITYISDWHCGISLDGHWIDIAPEFNWLGSCDVTIKVSDSIKPANDTFRVNIVPVVGITYMPIINSTPSK
jgi:hypothetical protein